MRVEVDREVATKMLNVYVIEDGIGGVARAWTPMGVGPEWTEVAPGASAPWSLRLPEDVWAAMLAAGADVPAPSRAQHDHLADAIMVRDRLLALVEGGATSTYGLHVPS